MKTEGLSFPEAVEKLAREVGLPVPRATPAERERAERVSTLQQVVEEAARWFQKQLRLPVGRQGLDYLRGRGLEDATIDDFRLGFAPDSRDGAAGAPQARERADRQDRRGGARHPARGQQPRALRPLPRPRDVSHQRPARPRDRLRRPRHGRGRAQVPQLARDAAVPQGRQPLLPRPRAAGRDQGPAGHRGRRLHGRDRAARRGLHRRGGAARHGADRRPARRAVEARRRALSLLRRRQCRPARRQRAPPSARCRCCAPARACASSRCRRARIPTA